MTYRRAWLLTSDINKTFAEPVVQARDGGRNGGATLTTMGEQVITVSRPGTFHAPEHGRTGATH